MHNGSYGAGKKDIIMKVAGKWKELLTFVLGEVIHIPKDKYHIFSFIVLAIFESLYMFSAIWNIHKGKEILTGEWGWFFKRGQIEYTAIQGWRGIMEKKALMGGGNES